MTKLFCSFIEETVRIDTSFIKYLADKLTGRSIDASLVDFITATGFGTVAV